MPPASASRAGATPEASGDPSSRTFGKNISPRNHNNKQQHSYYMTKQITRISILQSSKIIVALYVLFGFIYTLIGIPLIIFGGKEMMIMGVIYAAMPVIMGIFGFIFFALFAAIYNLLAKWLGGVEVVVSDIETK
jgi:uncharacterized membrane protein